MWKTNRALRLRALELAVEVKREFSSTELGVTELANGYYQFLRKGIVSKRHTVTPMRRVS